METTRYPGRLACPGLGVRAGLRPRQRVDYEYGRTFTTLKRQYRSNGWATTRAFPQNSADTIMDPFMVASSLFDEEFRVMERMQRDMDARFAEARRIAEDAERVGGNSSNERLGKNERVQELGGNNWRQWRREYKDDAPGRHVYYTESITTFGGPYSSPANSFDINNPPGSLLSPFSLLGIALLLGAWGSLTASFARKYHTTIYSQKWKWVLLALWPILALISPRFREEWRRAVSSDAVKNNPTKNGETFRDATD